MMKGLSTIKKPVPRKQSQVGLMRLQRSRQTDWRDPFKVRNQQQTDNSRCYYPCAYHVGQRITNFCRNENCLLPLCPKCIKVHSQQHERMGIYATYPTIQQCLSQCKTNQSNSITRLQQLSQVCQQMTLLHHQQIIQSKQQLQKAKQQLTQYIDVIFSFYQLQTQKVIQQTFNNYQQQILLFHKQIMALMASQKQLQKKYHNENTRMQFLIDFHTKQDITYLLNQHAATIDTFKPNYLQLSINTYELQRLKVIIKKYLDFGEFNSLIQQNLQSNIHYKKLTINPYFPYDKQYENENNNNDVDDDGNKKQFVRSPIKNLWTTPHPKQQIVNNLTNTKYESFNIKNSKNYLQDFYLQGQFDINDNENRLIGGMIREKIQRQSKLQKFQSPLQTYSLQKSRKQRN